MGKWLDLARDMETGTRDVSDNSANRTPNVTNVSIVTGCLIPELERGLSKLRDMPTPRQARGWSPVWRRIVSDALWLRTEGYASQAIALGWEPLHLFGIRPKEESNARPGLAVWLDGSRRLVLLDDGAISRDGDLRRCFNCRSTDGAVFLWELV